MRPAVLIAAVVLAGCMDPAPEGQAWTEATSDVWFTHTVGCSSCGFPSSTHVQASTVALYRDGSAMWYEFGLLGRDDGTTFEAGLESWKDEVLAVKQAQHDGWNEETIHVFSVSTIHVEDWDPTSQRLDEWHGSLADPGDPPQDCADCAAQWVEAFDPHIHAALRDNHTQDGAWAQVLGVLHEVRQQIDEQHGS